MNPLILLVDDDEDFLNITKELLVEEEPTLELKTTTSAHEALHKLAVNQVNKIFYCSLSRANNYFVATRGS